MVDESAAVGLSAGVSAARPTRVRPSFAWARRYAQRVLVTDVLALVAALSVAWFLSAVWLGRVDPLAIRQGVDVDGAVVIGALFGVWMLVLVARDAWDPRILGIGGEEYKRLIDSSLVLLGIVLGLTFFLRIELDRGFVAIAFVLGIVLLVAARWSWRRWLVRQRRAGDYTMRALLVGSRASVAELAGQLSSAPQAGYTAVGACLPVGRDASAVAGLPILGGLKSVARAAHAAQADIVIITSSDHLPASVVREISWSLEPWEIDVAVAPSLADIAGPRVMTRPLGGLPLIHLEAPSYEAGAKVLKSLFDFVMGWLLLILFSPVMLVVAIAVKATSPGPILYRQERIGLDRQPFQVLKFRSMRAESDAELTALLAQQGRDGQPLFKVDHDPRVTPLGRVLRQYSLDELPQLLNVVRGDMSLVGPRPQRPAEVALYDSAAGRRLFVKPGITGLWQVSGRSNLSWQDAVRLDLYYVENWSLATDLVLLARTAYVVVRKDGAV